MGKLICGGACERSCGVFGQAAEGDDGTRLGGSEARSHEES